MLDFNSPEFQLALGAYEGLLTAQEAAGRKAADAAPEVLSKIDVLFPGFELAHAAYVDFRRTQTDVFTVAASLTSHPDAVSWYTGPNQHVGSWPKYRKLLESKLFNKEALDVDAARASMEKAVSDTDASTSQILSRCANPLEAGDRRKGLVIGYVQSGKTANYAGVIAKAVDAGYRLVIVLAGMYSNLRAQTQVRLAKDLSMNALDDSVGRAWHLMTGPNADFAGTDNIGFLNNHANVGVIIVKKNTTRLANLAAFMETISKDKPFTGGVLIVDDESDQATPNTRYEKNEISAINKHVRKIWELTNTGTYLAYTATPFANIFIDPADKDDLYPEDFIVSLPRPDGYMGADTFFNLTGNADAPEETIDQLSRNIPQSDVDLIAVPAKDLESYSPKLPPSLDEATRWFLLATAIRQIRTQKVEHSSMLVHTSHRVVAHERFKEMMQGFVREIAGNRDAQAHLFRDIFDKEVASAQATATEEFPEWSSVWERTYDLIGRLKVVVDNGYSTDRLAYPDDLPQLVIAIGGGTLSRGLTLEGLVTSYFLRTSNTYDTLLQMGRWFGFRPRYADLVRIWTTDGLLDDYRHLAQVEKELRDEVSAMEKENRSPREYALRVRSHPGRLSIVSANKMSAARMVSMSRGGTRHQGTILDRSIDTITRRASAATDLVRAAKSASLALRRGDAVGDAVVFTGVPPAAVSRFLRAYSSPAEGDWLQADSLDQWIARHRPTASWHVVIAAGRSSTTKTYQLDTDVEVRVVKRAPLASAPGGWLPSPELTAQLADGSDLVNIRTLMSGGDWLLDAEILAHNGRLEAGPAAELHQILSSKSDEPTVKAFRARHFADIGVIVLYAIDKASQPDANGPRVPMDAPADLIGVGIVYPTSERKDDHTYFAAEIAPLLEEALDSDDEDEQRPLVDNEADFVEGES